MVEIEKRIDDSKNLHFGSASIWHSFLAIV
jgi:hypothetical protein